MREFCKKKKKIIINIHEKKTSQGASPQNVLLIAYMYMVFINYQYNHLRSW